MYMYMQIYKKGHLTQRTAEQGRNAVDRASLLTTIKKPLTLQLERSLGESATNSTEQLAVSSIGAAPCRPDGRWSSFYSRWRRAAAPRQAAAGQSYSVSHCSAGRKPPRPSGGPPFSACEEGAQATLPPPASLIESVKSWHPVLLAFLGTFFGWFMTALGSGAVVINYAGLGEQDFGPRLHAGRQWRRDDGGIVLVAPRARARPLSYRAGGSTRGCPWPSASSAESCSRGPTTPADPRSPW